MILVASTTCVLTSLSIHVHDIGQTHNVVLVGPIAEFVVAMNAEGQILSRGSVSEVLASAKDLGKEIEKEQEVVDALDAIDFAVVDGKKGKTDVKKNGKLVVAEEVAVGHVSWKASALPHTEPAFCCANDLGSVNLLFASQGGSHPALFWTAFIGFMFVAQIFLAGQV
jgi:hypothetical protein